MYKKLRCGRTECVQENKRAPYLKASRSLQQSCEVFLRAANFAAVHVHEEQLHVLEMHVFENDDRVLARVPSRQEIEHVRVRT